MQWLIIIIIGLLLYKLKFVDKIHIIYKTFFKKGFKKHDDYFGLYTYIGQQGEGKTFSAIRSIIDLKVKKEYIVITNVSSFNSFADTIYMADIIDIIDFIEREQRKNKDFERCKYLIFFDEIFSVIQKNERNSQVLQRIVNFLAQLRKRGIIFVSTAQVWSEIPIQYRKLCRFAIDCHMINIPVLDFAISTNKIMDGYNAKWNNDTQDFEAPTLQTNVFKCNKVITEQYDTYEVINYKRRINR